MTEQKLFREFPATPEKADLDDALFEFVSSGELSGELLADKICDALDNMDSAYDLPFVESVITRLQERMGLI